MKATASILLVSVIWNNNPKGRWRVSPIRKAVQVTTFRCLVEVEFQRPEVQSKNAVTLELQIRPIDHWATPMT